MQMWSAGETTGPIISNAFSAGKTNTTRIKSQAQKKKHTSNANTVINKIEKHVLARHFLHPKENTNYSMHTWNVVMHQAVLSLDRRPRFDGETFRPLCHTVNLSNENLNIKLIPNFGPLSSSALSSFFIERIYVQRPFFCSLPLDHTRPYGSCECVKRCLRSTLNGKQQRKYMRHYKPYQWISFQNRWEKRMAVSVE